MCIGWFSDVKAGKEKGLSRRESLSAEAEISGFHGLASSFEMISSSAATQSCASLLQTPKTSPS